MPNTMVTAKLNVSIEAIVIAFMSHVRMYMVSYSYAPRWQMRGGLGSMLFAAAAAIGAAHALGASHTVVLPMNWLGS